MTFQLPTYVLTVLEQLNHHGFEAYVVGGCVRDMLLGIPPGDYDICTNATPTQILTCFEGFRTIPTGIQHGTVTVICEEHPLEITTYRLDGEYSDGRHPDGVSFTSSLEEDLARRDFTVNAMAYHPACGLVDLFDGQRDLQNQIIRCVGQPVVRLTEDALRILRGLRFASTLSFSLDDDLVKAMEFKKQTLCLVAKERIFQELTKLLSGKGAEAVLKKHKGILESLFSVARLHEKGLCALPSDSALRYAYWLQEIPSSRKFLKELKAPNVLIDRVEQLILLLKEPLPTTLHQTRLLVCGYGREVVEEGIRVIKANGNDTCRLEEYFSKIQKENLCCSLKELAIGGNDLLQSGFPAGKELGDCLELLLHLVMQGKLENQKADLLEYVRTMK